MQGISAIHLKKYVIVPSIKSIDLYSKSAVNLLLGTAAHESHLGHYLKQKRGPALGIYQIEPNTHKDIWTNYINYRDDLIEKIFQLYKIDHYYEQIDQKLISDLSYATIITRLIYYRIPEKLPISSDIDGLARYWKKYYNTHKGKGTISAFVKNYKTQIKNNSPF